jgi:outer membrane lipoprotein-sorting protein
MKSCIAMGMVLSVIVGCAPKSASAQDAAPPPAPAPKTPPAEAASPANAPAAPGTSVDEILDALDRQGDQMKDFTADVALTETDDLTKESSTRAGKVKFQRLPDDDARIRVIFETKKSGDGPAKPEKIEYLLEKGWLTERNYRRKDNVRRQVLKPGEKINLLKLGEGPFPLPIGQAKEDVKQMFEVEIIPPAADDPAGTIHGRLTPKPKTQFERKFKSIDVWVDPEAQMPRRIQTLDRSGSTIQTTDLENVKANSGLTDDDFRLEEVKARDGWKLRDEPYEE